MMLFLGRRPLGATHDDIARQWEQIPQMAFTGQGCRHSGS